MHGPTEQNSSSDTHKSQLSNISETACLHGVDSSSTAPAHVSSSTPFRFLDLPKELRLLVYELLPLRTKHTLIQAEVPDRPTIAFTIMTKHVPGCSILATCQQINSEASSIRQKLNRILTQSPMMIVDMGNFGFAAESAMLPLVEYLALRKKAPDARYEEMSTPYDSRSPVHTPAVEVFIQKSVRQMLCQHSSSEATSDTSQDSNHVIEIGITAPTDVDPFLLSLESMSISPFYIGDFKGTHVYARIIAHRFPPVTDTQEQECFHNPIQRATRINNGVIYPKKKVDMHEWQKHWEEGEQF